MTNVSIAVTPSPPCSRSRDDDLLVVPGLGSTTYDLAAAGDNDRNFYLWGAMGGAAMIGLGLALAQPDTTRRGDHRRWRDADGHRAPRDHRACSSRAISRSSCSTTAITARPACRRATRRARRSRRRGARLRHFPPARRARGARAGELAAHLTGFTRTALCARAHRGERAAARAAAARRRGAEDALPPGDRGGVTPLPSSWGWRRHPRACPAGPA